jgi:hypothetical protein
MAVCFCGYEARDVESAAKAMNSPNHTQSDHAWYVIGRSDGLIAALTTARELSEKQMEAVRNG